MTNTPSEGVVSIREVMEGFIAERLSAKLEKLSPKDPKYQELQQQFEYEVWIADAARRVAQLQVVTHSLKAIHPDAKGTNLFVQPSGLPKTDSISSHLLESDYASDVVGNAAALDVYKFLKLEHNGKSLLELALCNDPDFVQTLNSNPDVAREQAAAFAAIVESKGVAASSPQAKQLFWLVGDDPIHDDQFHLLAPLYPTSLVHRVFQIIQEDRFGEKAKSARQARREGKISDTGYSDYPQLAVQKLGGTKPQNISQLNSERRGENYLLASLPPQWRSSQVRPPLYTDSVFPSFGRQREVRFLVRSLLKFLQSNPPNTMDTRTRVESIVDALIDELVIFSSRLQMLDPGWSTDDECRLSGAQALWLDAGRCDIDASFKVQRDKMDWPEEIEEEFAKWFNRVLRELHVGDHEYARWLQLIRRRLSVFQEEILHEHE